MVQIRAKTINDIDVGKEAYDFHSWCNNKPNCLYKNKKRKFHGWINLDNLQYGGTAQCGWDDGDCDHRTLYGWGGYHNICPIAGYNGDYVWPAKLQFLNFNFPKYGITKSARIKSVSVHIEHRMIAIDTGTGKHYDNFGPNFQGNGWVAKVYFTNNNNKVSETKIFNSNPKLSKKNFSSFEFKFTDITANELFGNNFALNIEYNHNFNTNPGIIYIKNIYIDVDYQNAEMFIEGRSGTQSLYTSTESACCTAINQDVIYAGYKDLSGKQIHSSLAPSPQTLGQKIICISKPSNVSVQRQSVNDIQAIFKITDNTGIAGKKKIVYQIQGYPKKQYATYYNAILRPKPKYSITQEYKSNEDFDPNKSYIIFKDGCSSKIYIYIDSIDSTPITLSVTHQNSSTNLLDENNIRKFHNNIKQLSCGYHTLYIRRGTESIQDAQKNKVIIKIKPMNFKFKIYTNENPQKKLEFNQRKTTSNEQDRYSTILIERTDDEPQEIIPNIQITDETQPSIITPKTNIEKGDIIEYNIDKYYAGEYYITVTDLNPCNGNIIKEKIIINGSHKQNYDYLFTRGEKGTSFNFDYLVAWEGDNIREPLLIDSINLQHSPNDIKICSDSVQAGLSQINTIELKVSNKTQEIIENVEIELNTLIKNENEELEVTTSEWTDSDGIFNQFYNLFNEYNITLNKNVEVLNLTPDNDLIDEENVCLLIHQIEANDTITILLPFRSVMEKTVYLQYLLFEEPLKINSINNCDSLINSENTKIQIDVYDSMLTKLEIKGNTDLLILDQSFECPNECYTTKDVDEFYRPIADIETGGITYTITNIDTNNFENQQTQTKIINSNEIIPYGYILKGNYYSLIDENDNPITIQENQPLLDNNGNQLYKPQTDQNGNIMLDQNGNIVYDTTKPLYKPNKLNWIRKEEVINKPMANQNIVCQVQFPKHNKVTYTVKTDKNGLVNFFIPIPTNLTTTYTINELLFNVLSFTFKEQKEYNQAMLGKNSQTTPNENKYDVILDYGNNYKRYQPGNVAIIPIFLSANIPITQNYFIFNAELENIGDKDSITILYKICNIDNNEGIFKTTFKTNDKRLIPNEITKNIYCGILTNIDIDTKIEKKVVESSNLNVIYINAINGKKENKDVEIQINLGKIPLSYLGKYDFLNIDIESGDYSITEEDNGNFYISWLIGKMQPFAKEKCVITIKAKDIGLSDILIESFDYLHLPPNRDNVTFPDAFSANVHLVTKTSGNIKFSNTSRIIVHDEENNLIIHNTNLNPINTYNLNFGLVQFANKDYLTATLKQNNTVITEYDGTSATDNLMNIIDVNVLFDADVNITYNNFENSKNIGKIEVKQSKCLKCGNNNWVIEDSLWKNFNGVWYKLFPDGKYKKPTKITLKNGKYTRKWVEKK